MKKEKQMIAFVIAASMCAGLVTTPVTQAAPKIKLSTNNMTLKTGQTKKLSLKKSKKTAKWSVVSGKESVRLKNKKKDSVRVEGVKKGTAKVQAKIGKSKCFCKVTVQEAKTKKPKKTQAPTVTNSPVMVTNPPAVVTNSPVVVTDPPAPVTPMPDTDNEKINRLPETINEEEIQAATWSEGTFELDDSTTFGDCIWIQEDRTITVELLKGMTSLKEVVPDPSANIKRVRIEGEVYEVLLRNVVSFVGPAQNGTDGMYYNFNVYYYKDGAYYYQRAVMLSAFSKEDVAGEILNRGEKLPAKEFSEVMFSSQSDPEGNYYSSKYDGEVFEIRVPAGTYNVSVKLAGNDYYISAGTVTIEEGTPNKLSLQLNVAYVSGKVTKNGNKPDEIYTMNFIRESNNLWINCKTDENGNYKVALPEGDYKVNVGDTYYGMLFVSETESEISKDFDVKVKDLTLDQQQDCTISEDGTSVAFKFTPAETAVYEWNLLRKGDAGRFDWSMSSERGTSSSGFYLDEEEEDTWMKFSNVVLIEGVTYQIAIQGEDLEKDVNTALKITKSDQTEEIALNQTKEWEQYRGTADMYYYRFTVPEDGTYRFSGTASKEEALEDMDFVMCSLYAKDRKASSTRYYKFDSATKKGTIEKEVELKKGDVVITEIYVNCYTMSGDFTISKVE